MTISKSQIRSKTNSLECRILVIVICLLFVVWNFSPKRNRFLVDQTGCLRPEAVLNVEPLAQIRL